MRAITTTLLTIFFILSLVACSAGAEQPAASAGQSAGAEQPAASAGQSTGAGQATSGAATSATAPAATPAASVPEALAVKDTAHDDADELAWDASAVIEIRLEGDAISAEGRGVAVEGSTATISSAGSYRLSGALADGQIIVDTQDEQTVQLILDGAELHSSTSAPINIVSADEVVIILAENSENTITDAASYTFASADTDEPNAAIFSAANLTISGEGALTVRGSFNDGIASKDGLVIVGGTITVEAADDGIRGKDYVVVKGGSISVAAQGDGIKADNAEDATKGYVAVEDGSVSVASGGDAIAAETDVLVAGGTLDLTTSGGGDVTSAKGIKGVANVTIDGGALTISSADDALHSNGNVTINGGTFAITTSDDGAHADATLTINGGELSIAQSYEGLEGEAITINGGTTSVVASDDGVNVAGGVDGSGMRGPGGMRGGPGGGTQDAFAYTGSTILTINGGYLAVDAAGDGLDANGAIIMTDGIVVVNGPTERMNGALDYDAGFNISGGLLVAAGSAGMAQAPGGTSSQNSLLVNYTATQQPGTLVQVLNADGAAVLTFAPSKAYQSLAFSSPELVEGSSYTIVSGGSASGTASDGLYQGAAASGGSEYASFSISSVVTQIGTSARMR